MRRELRRDSRAVAPTIPDERRGPPHCVVAARLVESLRRTTGPLQAELPKATLHGRDVGGGAVVFTDVTAAAGLSRAVNTSGNPDKQFLLEEMGCGAAFFDYDHDGWLDIFLVNGTSLDPKVRDSRPTSYLFHNNRDGTFTDVTKSRA